MLLKLKRKKSKSLIKTKTLINQTYIVKILEFNFYIKKTIV